MVRTGSKLPDLTGQTQEEEEEGNSTEVSDARVRVQIEWFTEIKCQRDTAADLVSFQSQQAMRPVREGNLLFQQRVFCYVTADFRCNDFTVQNPTP